MRIFKQQGYAFIRYETKDAACQSIVNLNNSEINGQTVRASWGRAADQSGQPQGGAPAGGYGYGYGGQGTAPGGAGFPGGLFTRSYGFMTFVQVTVVARQVPVVVTVDRTRRWRSSRRNSTGTNTTSTTVIRPFSSSGNSMFLGDYCNGQAKLTCAGTGSKPTAAVVSEIPASVTSLYKNYLLFFAHFIGVRGVLYFLLWACNLFIRLFEIIFSFDVNEKWQTNVAILQFLFSGFSIISNLWRVSTFIIISLRVLHTAPDVDFLLHFWADFCIFADRFFSVCPSAV